jgi:hypothetical protein
MRSLPGRVEFLQTRLEPALHLSLCILHFALPSPVPMTFDGMRKTCHPARIKDARAYFTYEDLAADTRALAPRLAAEVQAVVGIARSGMLPASQLACQLHVPLYAASRAGLTSCGHGYRLEDGRGPLRQAALVDDTAFGGRMMRTLAPVAAASLGVRMLRVAVYSTRMALGQIDLCSVVLQPPHYLEWNLFNSGQAEAMASDLDGVLCEDIAAVDDDDGPRYAAALARARPRHLPRRRPIPLIVTARLEKYRGPTEAWLARHGVTFGRLAMGPWTDLAQRSADWPHRVARFKAEQYEASACRLLVESDAAQARLIAQWTGRRVLCPALGRVL